MCDTNVVKYKKAKKQVKGFKVVYEATFFYPKRGGEKILGRKGVYVPLYYSDRGISYEVGHKVYTTQGPGIYIYATRAGAMSNAYGDRKVFKVTLFDVHSTGEWGSGHKTYIGGAVRLDKEIKKTKREMQEVM